MSDSHNGEELGEFFAFLNLWVLSLYWLFTWKVKKLLQLNWTIRNLCLILQLSYQFVVKLKIFFEQHQNFTSI